jgi:hypothetical protein
VLQARLPPTIGLGTTWVIGLATSPHLPPVATERYEAAFKEYRDLYPEDVVDFPHIQRQQTNRYLLLRTGSPAVAHWLSRFK